MLDARISSEPEPQHRRLQRYLRFYELRNMDWTGAAGRQ